MDIRCTWRCTELQFLMRSIRNWYFLSRIDSRQRYFRSFRSSALDPRIGRAPIEIIQHDVSSLWTHSNDPWNGTQRANESTCSCIFFVVCLTSRFRLKFIRCAAESCHVKARQSWERWKAVVECGRRLEKFFASFLTSLCFFRTEHSKHYPFPIRTTTKRALLGHATLDIHSIRFF